MHRPQVEKCDMSKQEVGLKPRMDGERQEVRAEVDKGQASVPCASSKPFDFYYNPVGSS